LKNIYRKHPKLRFHYIIIQKSAIKSLYKGGLKQFTKDFELYQYNGEIIVLNAMGVEVIDRFILMLENKGLKQIRDYMVGIEEPPMPINIL